MNKVIGQAIFGGVGGERAVVKTAQSEAARSYPNRAVPLVVEQRYNQVARQAVFGGEAGNDTILHAVQSAICAKPERTSFSTQAGNFQKLQDPVVLKCGGIEFIEHRKPCAVVPRKPFFGAYPQVPIIGLANCPC